MLFWGDKDILNYIQNALFFKLNTPEKKPLNFIFRFFDVLSKQMAL